jgi:fused signal recognition particle receptor
MKIFKNTFSKIFKSKNKIKETFSKVLSFTSLSQEDKDKMQECLLSSDLGWELTEKTLGNLEKIEKNESWEDVLLKTLKSSVKNLEINSSDIKKVILIIGVNGSGKTTSAAKLANFFKINNKSVTLVAADTYRAAAVEQLKIWAQRTNINFISNPNTQDPASIAFDGVKSGITRGDDYIIIDTAGRLHTSKNLMNELEKVYRVIGKITDEISVLISIDGNTGQNGIKQATEFGKTLPIDNIVLNKMDGTAKGGVALSIMHQLSIPVSFLGIGESFEDLLEFDLDNYLESLIK